MKIIIDILSLFDEPYLSMKFLLASSAFLTQALGRVGLHRAPQNLHETGYDHGHLDSASCDDKNNMYELDNRGRGCDAYNGATADCGRYDDFDFVASSLCCACGGGLREDVAVTGWGVLDPSIVGQRVTTRGSPPPPPELVNTPGNRVIVVDGNTDTSGWNPSNSSSSSSGSCADGDWSGQRDARGYGCAAYPDPSLCGVFDNLDFVASTLCCACGGGSRMTTETSSWGALADNTTTTGRSSSSSTTTGRSSGGRSSGGRSSRRSSGGRSSNSRTTTTTTSRTTTSSGHDHHHHLNLHQEYATGLIVPEEVLLPAVECYDSNLGYGDVGGDQCDWYEGFNSVYCGNYDTETFRANEMCCSCGGGSTTPVRFTMECQDQAFGAVDNGGDGCEWYVGSNTEYCAGTFDDSDFTASTMCCSCGGGEFYPSPVFTIMPVQ